MALLSVVLSVLAFHSGCGPGSTNDAPEVEDIEGEDAEAEDEFCSDLYSSRGCNDEEGIQFCDKLGPTNRMAWGECISHDTLECMPWVDTKTCDDPEQPDVVRWGEWRCELDDGIPVWVEDCSL